MYPIYIISYINVTNNLLIIKLYKIYKYTHL